MKNLKLRNDSARTALSLWLVVAAAFLAPASARAASFFWTNTAGGNWNVANNWSAHIVPGASDTAIITNDGNYTVTLNVPVTLAGLVLGEPSGATTQTLTNNGQTLTLNGQATISANGQFFLVSATLSGTTVLAAGAMSWQSGVLSQTGSLSVAPNGVLNLAGSGTIQLEGPLTNNGTVNWLNGQVQVLNNNAVSYFGAIWNQPGANWFIQNNGQSLSPYFGTGTEIFHNAGLLSKTNVAGTSYINLYLNNTAAGTVQTQIGTIDLQAGSDLGGTFQAAAGTAIDFISGNYLWNGTANFQGPGPVQITGGSVTITAPIVSSFSASGIIITNLGNLGGTAYLTNCTIADAETIAGTINWGSGVLSLTGSLTVAPNGVLNLAGSGTIQLQGPLTNNGTVNWLNGQVQVLNNNAVSYFGAIWNQPGAKWFIQNNGQSLSPYFATGAEKFHNAGLLSKTNVAGTSYINLYLNNAAAGTVQTQTGTIDLQAGSDLGGTFQAAAGTAIDFISGNYLWNGTANFQGPGPVQITGGSVTITAPIVSSFSASGIIITNLGNLGGTAYLTNCTIADAETIAGTINWGSGVLNQTGSLTVAPNGVLNLAGSGTIQLEGPLTNNGTVNWLNGQVQVLNNNAVSYFGAIWNQPGANWFIQNNGQSLSPYFATGAEKFHNAGLLSKTNVAGTSYINLYLNNAAAGTVQTQTGTIDLQAGSDLGGTFQAAAGTAIDFISGNYLWNGTANFQGPGPVQITGGSVTITAPIVSSFSASGIIITNLGNLGGTAYLTNCTIADAETIAGTINWGSGVLNQTGSLTVTPNGMLNLAGSGTIQLEGPLTNNGTVNWLNGQIQVLNNNAVSYFGAIWNQPGAKWFIQNNGQSLSTYFGTGAEIFHNAGLLSKFNVAGTSYISTYLNNTTGTVDSEIGTLAVSGGYTLGAGGTLAFGLNNVASFGLISLANTAPLGGTLSVHLNNGYVPSAGNSFTVLSYGSAFGNFGATNLPPVATWQTTQGPSTLTIQVLTVVPQVSLSIVRAGNSVNVFWPNTGGFTLQQNTNLAVLADWTASGFAITTNSGTCSIAVSPPVGNLFFRLFHP